MFCKRKSENSARYTALFFFTVFILFRFQVGLNASLPLVETIYSIPENKIELGFREELVRTSGYYRRDNYTIGFNIFTNFSAWFTFQYIDALNSGKGSPGDSFFRFKYGIGDYFSDVVHASLLLSLRVPTGSNVYNSPEWRGLSMGMSEIKAGPLFRFDLPAGFFLHTNLFYTFRQGNGENFYGGFYFNFLKKNTWAKLFGLNPFADNTFINWKRLRNDSLDISSAVNTSIFYPLIPFTEISYIRSFSSGGTGLNRIEGDGISPIFLSAGARYFFNQDFYAGLSIIVAPLQNAGHAREIYALEVSIVF